MLQQKSTSSEVRELSESWVRAIAPVFVGKTDKYKNYYSSDVLGVFVLLFSDRSIK